MFPKGAIRLGAAPIGWTNDDMPELGGDIPFAQCVSEMALAGYEGTEIGNKYPGDPKVLEKELSLRSLKVAGAWFSSFLTTDTYENVEQAFIAHRDFLYDVGAGIIIISEQGRSIQKEQVPLFEEKPLFTEEEWTRLYEGLNKLGRLAREKNMFLVFHHHLGTGVQTIEETRNVMNHTDPDNVHLLFDTGHFVLAGEDPMVILNEYGDRIKHVHLKDVRKDIAVLTHRQRLSFMEAVLKGVFTVPGDGMITFPSIFEKLAALSYRGWFVVEAEQDPDIAPPLEYALKARAYIREQVQV